MLTEHKPPIKKQRPLINATITALSHDGRGIAEIEGKKIFVYDALPGENVNFHYTRRHKNFDEAQAIDILNPSPDRVTPQCPHFGNCGGCSLQHLAHDKQILAKQETLIENLQHFGGVTAQTILPPLVASPWHYRRKARLGVRYVANKNRVLVGFRERHNGRYIADIKQCEVLHPSVAKLLQPLSDCIEKLSCHQSIPQIEVAVGDDVTALIFRHLVPLTELDKETLIAFSRQYQVRIYLQPKNYESIYLLWPDANSDLISYHLPAEDITLEFHPADFTQVNFAINQAMIKRTLELLEPKTNEHILDLFCGLGNFSLPIAKKAQRVTAIEGSQTLIDRANYNAQRNNLSNVDFYCADLMKNLTEMPWAQQKFAKILIDPPRTGALEVIQQVAQFDANRLVYVSCNPATLARDAGILVKEQGYQLLATGIMDMFPHTSHVESIALFEK